MPRLLLINVALNWGSTGKIVEGIGKLVQSSGWEVYVAHGARYRNPSSLQSIQVTSMAGEWVHYIGSALFDGQGLGSRCATKRFLKQFESIKPDLVHIHNIHGCFLNYPILFKFLREHSIPVIWTLHDCWAMTGHCVHFMRTHCDKWKTGCGNCPQLRDFPSSYLLDRSRRNYTLKKDLFTSMEDMQITTVSSWLKGVAEESYLGKFPITVVPNGLNSIAFKPTVGIIREKYGLQGKKILLGVASGFGDRKGLYDYIQLAKRLSASYKIVLVGVMESDKKELPDSIIAVDRANGAEELAAFYTCADVLLSLSYEETFGMTIVEAMACGTPAIVYDNTAQPELITPETGSIIPTGDLDALVKAIKGICGKEKSAFEETCRNHAIQYDEAMSYQKYLDIYKSVINKTK